MRRSSSWLGSRRGGTGTHAVADAAERPEVERDWRPRDAGSQPLRVEFAVVELRSPRDMQIGDREARGYAARACSMNACAEGSGLAVAVPEAWRQCITTS